MDNKRKVIGTFAGKPSKLRKVNIFDTEDDDRLDVSGQPSALSGTQAQTSAPLDPEQKEVITKTALWIFSNPDKANVLLGKAKENPALSFLNDSKGETTAGRLYLQELQRCRTEREVQAVCAGTEQAAAVHVSASQIASFINMNRQAAAASAVSNQGGASNGTISDGKDAAPRERRNRWGPSVDQPVSSSAVGVVVPPPPPPAPSAYYGSTTQYISPAPPQVPSSSSAKGLHRSAATQPSEADQIAHMAANFDRTPAEDQRRLDRLLQEQREMQLLESRIRDAAAQGFSAGGSAGSAGHSSVTEVAKFLAEHSAESRAKRTANGEPDPYAVNLAARKGPALLIAEKQAALYLERLAQYEELARNEDDKYRDTVEECERNGGVIEGGTWEHRKRAKEMLQTAAKNLELTLLGAGKHHMADYLPPEVLQSFLRNAEAVTGQAGASGSGTAAQAVAADSTRLDASNVGFQLLRKSGWTEGAGLGAQGTGIVNPISATGSSAVMVTVGAGSGSGGGGGVGAASAVAITGGRGPEGAGIGVQATHDVTAEDTEFDQYRKRMMLAYRFRPNPLNNPRRNYY